MKQARQRCGCQEAMVSMSKERTAVTCAPSFISQKPRSCQHREGALTETAQLRLAGGTRRPGHQTPQVQNEALEHSLQFKASPFVVTPGQQSLPARPAGYKALENSNPVLQDRLFSR